MISNTPFTQRPGLQSFSWALSFQLSYLCQRFSKNCTVLRPIAYILLVYWSLGSLFPLGDFSQLAMLPSLVEHYRLHKAESEQALSFPAFFALHYSGASSHHHHDDGAGHHDLPLKTLHEFQWVSARFAPSLPSFPAGSPACLADLSDYPLSEGARSAVFRPPLAA